MTFRVPFAIALMGLATPALAQAVLPIGGIFGNATGCTYFMTGSVDSDDLLLLTPDTFSTYASGCDFTRLVARTRDTYTLAAVCSSEEDESHGELEVVVTDHGNEGLSVALEGVGEWGPLLSCPGTEDMVTSSGVRV